MQDIQTILSENINIFHLLYRIGCHLFAVTLQQGMSISHSSQEDHVPDDASPSEDDYTNDTTAWNLYTNLGLNQLEATTYVPTVASDDFSSPNAAANAIIQLNQWMVDHHLNSPLYNLFCTTHNNPNNNSSYVVSSITAGSKTYFDSDKTYDGAITSCPTIYASFD